MAGFSYRKNLDGSSYVPSLRYVIGKNAIAFTVGDAVRINTSGFVDVATAGEGICGFVAQVVTRARATKDSDSATSLDTYTMSSDNQTVAKDMIAFIPALPHYLFYNDSDATLTEAMIGMYFNAISTTQVDGDTNHDTTEQTFRLWEFDPDHDGDASKGLFQVVESQFGATSWDREA